MVARREINSVVVLLIFLAVAVASAVPMAGKVGWGAIVLLFVAGFGAGVSFRAYASRARRRASAAHRPGKPEPRKRSPQGRPPKRGKRSLRRPTGTVKWFNAAKGYGFITVDDGSEDCFVHRSAIRNGDAIAEGERVEFEIIRDDRGRRAAGKVTRIEG